MEAMRSHRWPGSGRSTVVARWMAIAVFLVCPLLVSEAADAQTLRLKPGCIGLNESEPREFQVTGSGWSVQGPEWCLTNNQFYRFKLNGTVLGIQTIQTIGRDQPDKVLTLPTGLAPGIYPVRVELWCDVEGVVRCVQCIEIDLCVVQAKDEQSPWAPTYYPIQEAGPMYGVNQLRIEFRPQGQCELPKCKSIRFIQLLRDTGLLEGSREAWDQQQFVGSGGHANYLLKNWNMTVPESRWRIDLPDGKQPFYAATRQEGKSELCGAGGKSGVLADTPLISDAAMQRAHPYADNRKYYLTYAYCADGEGSGQFLGMVSWDWTRAYGQSVPPPPQGVYSPQFQSYDVDPVSGHTALVDALGKFSTVTGSTTPLKVVDQPGTGGRPCSCQ